MRLNIVVMIGVNTVLLGALSISALWAAPAATSKPLLRHLVLYKFKDSAGPAQIDEIVAAFSALPRQIKSIAAFERGANVSSEGKSQGFTHAFLVSFRDEKGRDEYLTHPAHQKYVELVRDRREQVVVFDYWASE